jgi:hypothetical protein
LYKVIGIKKIKSKNTVLVFRCFGVLARTKDKKEKYKSGNKKSLE